MIAIIQGLGANIASVQFALERIGKQSILTTDPAVIRDASHVILPGVGTANYAMKQLHNLQLIDCIRELHQPVLGICLGMQLLFEYSAEAEVACLGILSGRVEAIPRSSGLTTPHMGWNQLKILNIGSVLLKDIENGSYVYFVHSYAAPVNQHTIAKVHYGSELAAIVQHKNFYGTQFHPERSGMIGQNLLRNFISL